MIKCTNEKLQLEKFKNALIAIAVMDCYTRPDEEMPHLLMMRIAKEALENERTIHSHSTD